MKDGKQIDTGNLFPKYYYETDDLIGNIYTACILVDKKDCSIVSRGIAVRSLLDMHKKSVARDIAHGRAIKALSKQDSSDEINVDRQRLPQFVLFKMREEMTEAELARINEIFFIPEGSKNIYVPRFYPLEETAKQFKFKSEFRPEPTEKEKRIATKLPKVE
jgi:hypothetical protein